MPKKRPKSWRDGRLNPPGDPELPMVEGLDEYCQKVYFVLIKVYYDRGVEDETGCWVKCGRRKLARYCNLTESRVEQAIYKLEQMGYIKRVRMDDRKKGCMYWNYRTYMLTMARGALANDKKRKECLAKDPRAWAYNPKGNFKDFWNR